MDLDPVVRPREQVCAFPSKKLDPIVSEWLPCLRIFMDTTLLIEDTDKLALVKELYITPCHQSSL